MLPSGIKCARLQVLKNFLDVCHQRMIRPIARGDENDKSESVIDRVNIDLLHVLYEPVRNEMPVTGPKSCRNVMSTSSYFRLCKTILPLCSPIAATSTAGAYN